MTGVVEAVPEAADAGSATIPPPGEHDAAPDFSHRQAADACPWVGLDANGTGLDLQDFPSFLLVRLVHALQRRLTRLYLEPDQLTLPDWRVLSFVRVYGPARFSDLASRMALDKAQVSRTVKHLESRGLISAMIDPEHQQRVILDVTAAGRRLHKRIMPIAAKAQASFLAPLDDDERRVVHRALRKLQAVIDDDGAMGVAANSIRRSASTPQRAESAVPRTGTSKPSLAKTRRPA